MRKRIINVGEKYNSLTVIERVIVNDSCRWLCQCECGNTTSVQGSFLIRGEIKSCGCKQFSDQLYKTRCKVLGKSYGPYTVLAKASNGQYLCKCTCGNTMLLDTNQFRPASKCKCKKYLSKLS